MCAFNVTSPATEEYNCVAWAVHHQRQVLWPDERNQYGWPIDLAREETLAGIKRFFALVGFEDCADGSIEVGFEKIAIYTGGGEVRHVARQLQTGEWTSKMGAYADGSHTIDEFNQFAWQVAAYMKRSSLAGPPVLPRMFPPPALLVAPGGAPLA